LQNIQYVKRTNNDETFSFRIYQVPTATFLQNIVVECKEKSKPQTYLVTYYLNKQANQINNSNDFIRAIKSTSIIKIENQLKTHRTTSGGCLQVGYYEEVDACDGNLDTRPRCYNSDGTRATIKVFKVIDSACSTGGGPTDFIPIASQWNYYNTSASNPYSGNTVSGTGTGINGGGETTYLNIFAPNYFEGADLSDPAVQNWLQVNQFMTTLYNSSNKIKNVIDATEWLMVYTNYWIGSNGGLTSSNQIRLTFAFNTIPILFNQYYGTIYEPSQIANFQFSVFQFLLFHGEFLSKLDSTTQKSILDGLTSFEQIEQINTIVNYMIQNPGVTLENTKNLLIAQAIEDKIDDSALDPCTKGVLDKLKLSTEKDVSKMINRFNPATSVFNIKMSTGKVRNTVNWAETTKAASSAADVNMVFNEDYIKGTLFGTRPTDLSVATTMAHEIIHAYLISLLEDHLKNSSVGINDFPTIFDAYVQQQASKNTSILPDAHHELIADKYVNAIASTIEQFHLGDTFHSGYPRQVYLDMAWGGLKGTKIFNKTYPQGSADRDRILDRINTEMKGTPYQGYTPLGTPCKN